MRKIVPPYLVPGDEVGIISPAFAIDRDKVDAAVRVLENWGLKVSVGRNALNREGPFAGKDSERLSDFQEMTENKNIRAIFCSRGGYGMLKIIDRIDFSALKKNPRWYVGFSDITILHLWLSEKENIESIHGEMPLNFVNPEKSPMTLGSLRNALFGNLEQVKWSGQFLKPGNAQGEITGGNLSLIYSLIGTPAQPKTKGRILFIEEVGEYYYHLDRMLTSMKLTGMLKDLKALVVGGMTEMTETKIPWGRGHEEIIGDIVKDYDYPVFFNFPAGHIPDNRAFYIGRKAEISTDGKEAVMTYS